MGYDDSVPSATWILVHVKYNKKQNENNTDLQSYDHWKRLCSYFIYNWDIIGMAV